MSLTSIISYLVGRTRYCETLVLVITNVNTGVDFYTVVSADFSGPALFYAELL